MNRWILVFVVTFGFLARAAIFQSPAFDHHAWRQADGATMARNFYRDGINPWYPEIDARGSAEHGYVATGLELHAIAFGAVSRLTGFSPFVGRLISAACFPVSALFVWIFCRSRYDDTYALAAVFVYALCLPLVIYSERAIWNEPFLTMFSLAALAAAQRYLETRRRTFVFALALALAGLPRLPRGWAVGRFATTTLWLMLVFAFVRSVSFHPWYEVDQQQVQFCSLLKAGLKTSDRVAFADYNSPDILFCLDRRGWLTSTTEMSPAEARVLRDSGAAILAIAACVGEPPWSSRRHGRVDHQLAGNPVQVRT